jgi:holo-[acyl-carrier protein] synthase
MISCGVDLIEVSRVEQAVARQGARFLDRIFTAQEQAYCQARPERLAGRFAVKEAVAKALGTGIGAMRWVDIEVVCDPRGKPELVLHGDAARISAENNLVHWSISLSHTATHAIGYAIALGNPTSSQ